VRRRSGREQNGQSQCGAAFSSEKTPPRAFRPPAGAGSFIGRRLGAGADVANVDDARIIENAKTGKEWLSNGLDYGVNRFSPLDQITAANVGKLGLA
jgi:hypothetical protein